MGENIQVIPLAIIMMLGPQILSAMFILTGKNHIKASLAYILSIFLAASFGTLALMAVIDIFNIGAPTDSEPSTLVNVIKYAVVALLTFGIYKNYRDRNKKITPKWMKVIMAGKPKDNFKLGFFLVYVAPTDLTVMFSVAFYLKIHENNFLDALPFLLTTAFIAALPLLISLIFRKRAEVFLPKANKWLLENSWMVQVFVLALFIYMILS
jgi:hypothetical protein